jgi:hypothetical protein
MAMFDHNPVLRERMLALGAFTGIAVFAVAAVDVMITGGFDFAPDRTTVSERHPSAYVRMVDAAQYVSDQVRSVSWDQPALISEASAASTEELAGADDGSSQYANVSDSDLYREIGALYEESEPEAAYVEEPSYEVESGYTAESEDEYAAYEGEKY